MINNQRALGLGTAALGRPQYINLRQQGYKTPDLKTFRQHSFSVLEKAYQLGIRYFDTAPGYGMAEGLLLEWLQTKNDPSIIVATKWGYTYVADFNPEAKEHEIKEHSLTKLNEQWEFSKSFLPYLKVYQIHSATLETGVLNNQAILQQLAFIKKEYQIEIGITTTGTNQVEVINKALDVKIEGKSLFDVFQVTYNILDQSLIKVSEKLLQQNKKIIIKEAVANGRLFRNDNYLHYDKLYKVLDQLALQHEVGTDSIALKFCEQTIKGSIILSGAADCIQLESNIKMDNFELSQTDLETLKSFNISSSQYWLERKKLKWN